MEKQKFSDYGMFEGHSEYELAVQRWEDIYQRRYDLRSDFARDYTRIIFSQAYRRLKHKTQVFLLSKMIMSVHAVNMSIWLSLSHIQLHINWV